MDFWGKEARTALIFRHSGQQSAIVITYRGMRRRSEFFEKWVAEWLYARISIAKLVKLRESRIRNIIDDLVTMLACCAFHRTWNSRFCFSR